MRTFQLSASTFGPRSRWVVAVFCAALCPCPATLHAQTSSGGGVHCSVLPARPVTPADLAFAKGDATEAERLFAAQVASSSSIANYSGLLRAQLEQDKLTEALATARKAASALPTSAEALALEGDVQLRSGKITEAGDSYNKAVTLDPCSPHAQFGLGRLSDIAANHASATRKYAIAHALAPADPAIAIAFFSKQPEQQRTAGLRAVLAANPVLSPREKEQLTIAVALLDQHKSCTPAQEVKTANLTLEPLMFDGKYERSWGLRVGLNTASPALLELDTSVSGIVLTPKDAEAAGVHPLLPGASAQPPYTGVADRVRIANLEYHDCPVRVVPSADLNGGNSLIGADFFRENLIHIDYAGHLMALSPLPARPGMATQNSSAPADQYIAPEEKDWSKVYIAGSNLLLPTVINKKGSFLFLIDTGINRTVLSPAVETTLLSAQHDATLNLRGSSGEIVKVFPREGGGDVFVTDVRNPAGQLLKVTAPLHEPVYRFTNNEYGDQDSISFDFEPKSHEAGIEISGLLGFRILRNYFLDFNYRDALVRVQFDQNRRYVLREQAKSY